MRGWGRNGLKKRSVSDERKHVCGCELVRGGYCPQIWGVEPGVGEKGMEASRWVDECDLQARAAKDGVYLILEEA